MSRETAQRFDEFQKVCTTFVQMLKKLATRRQNIGTMQSPAVMQQLHSLRSAFAPSLEQSAALALERLENLSGDPAEAIISNEILPQLLDTLVEETRIHQKTSAQVLRAVAKHSPKMAQVVADIGGLKSLVLSLEVSDPGVRESAALALGAIVAHSGKLANKAMELGAMPLLVVTLMESPPAVRLAVVSAISEFAKHSADLAQKVVDAGSTPFLMQMLSGPDSDLRGEVCLTFAHIAKHTVDLAEFISSLDIFPGLLSCLKEQDLRVRKNAATCFCELAKQNTAIAWRITNAGGCVAMVEYISEVRGNARLPGIMTLGFLSAFEEQLAMGVINSKAVAPISDALTNEPEDDVKAAAAWSLGQMGRHSPDHARALAEANIPSLLLTALLDGRSSDDLKAKTKRALKSILQMCTLLDTLRPLLDRAPPTIMKYVLHQYSKLLPTNSEGQRSFAESGGLRKVQEISAPDGSKIKIYIESITRLYQSEGAQNASSPPAEEHKENPGA